MFSGSLLEICLAGFVDTLLHQYLSHMLHQQSHGIAQAVSDNMTGIYPYTHSLHPVKNEGGEKNQQAYVFSYTLYMPFSHRLTFLNLDVFVALQ